MHFPTLEFALFFAVVFTLSWWTRRFRSAQKLVLLAASLFFYAQIGLKFLLILLASSLSFYLAGAGITRFESKLARKLCVVGAILANLLLLGFFKYYNFFLEQVAGFAELLGLEAHIRFLEIFYPVGMSFFVFQGISYVLDLYWKRGPRARHFLDFLLYMSFFPQLLSGPICRGKELLPQFDGPAPERVPDVSRAVSLILSGLAKKAVLGHFLYEHLTKLVFDVPENFSSPALWVGMFGYAFMLYWDFSGYTDLARGLGLLLGYKIPENFDHPYVATDISDFWRRWHQTLSNWLRDYMFLPFAHSWSKGFRRFLPLKQAALWGSQLSVFVTFVLCGLWHGAAWTFIIWGTYHGVLLFVHHGLRNGLKLRWKGGWLGTAGTLLLVSFGWVLFNAADMSTAWLYLKRMFMLGAPGEGVSLLAVFVVVFGMVLHIAGPGIRNTFITLSERTHWVLRPALWFAVGMLLLAFKPAGNAPYIYFGF